MNSVQLIVQLVRAGFVIDLRFPCVAAAGRSAIVELPDEITLLRQHLVEARAAPGIAHRLNARPAVDTDNYRILLLGRKARRFDHAGVKLHSVGRLDLHDLGRQDLHIRRRGLLVHRDLRTVAFVQRAPRRRSQGRRRIHVVRGSRTHGDAVSSRAAAQSLLLLAIQTHAVELPLQRTLLIGNEEDLARLFVHSRHLVHLPFALGDLRHVLVVRRAKIKVMEAIPFAAP